MDKKIKKIHFVGVGGVGTGSLAQALVRAGYEVSGSDAALYDPMKSVLASASIKLCEGYLAEHAERLQPDLVVIANVVRKENPEAVAWIRSGIPYLSFPEAVRQFLIRDTHSIVCAGTHGKTTTTSWIAFLLESLGADPSYLIGGVPHNLEVGSRISEGRYFVGEGDEYDSAFFDKGPKFLHYKPDTFVLSGVEFDHADIYKDLDHVKAAFRKGIALIPGNGLCVARYEDPVVQALVAEAGCPVESFGLSDGADWYIDRCEVKKHGFEFGIRHKGKDLGLFRSPLLGQYNLMNLLSGVICAVKLGWSIDRVRPIVEKFQGVCRRQQVLATEPIVVIDDFAHHPTEVGATVAAVRERYPKGRLWALFEPRSATARTNTHQEAYVGALEGADHILIAEPYRNQEVSCAERFSSTAVADALKNKGKTAQALSSASEILEIFLNTYRPGDIVLVMSNGEFAKIQEKIVKAVYQL